MSNEPATGVESTEQVVAATKLWVEKAVIGLHLCPFAASPYLNDRVRYSVSDQRLGAGLLEDLSRELQMLVAVDPSICETVLLIHPHALNDFLQYNEFLDECDALLTRLELDGELQVASFHPAYQFAGTAAQDIENYTNRSPYPMLHLLREASITRAVATFPGIAEIGATNIQTLRRLGHDGWRRLWIADP